METAGTAGSEDLNNFLFTHLSYTFWRKSKGIFLFWLSGWRGHESEQSALFGIIYKKKKRFICGSGLKKLFLS